MSKEYITEGKDLGKYLRLIVNRLGVVLLISVVFLSIPQHMLPFLEQSIPLAYIEAVPATNLTLHFSTYLGGSEGSERGYGNAVSEDGSCYVTGQTLSSDFPTQNAFKNTISGDRDAFVAKLSGDGSLLWSTYFGGSDNDFGQDISVAGDSSCYVIGETQSSNFPILNAFNSTLSGNRDTFLAKFSSNGQLLWSTYLGGSEQDYGYSIAVASDGSCYVTGETESSDFPTKNAYDSTFNGGDFDAFVSKFSTNGNLLWSSYLGGSELDGGYGIAVTSDGGCYVTGTTGSSDFPTLDAYDPTPNGGWDVFVTKFSSSGLILWSTYFGGTGWEEVFGIDVANDDSCYITGIAGTSDFPLLNAFNSTLGGYYDAFVSKFSSEGSLLWSTFLGGSGGECGYAIAVTSDGCSYVTGYTYSSNFPTENAYDSTYNGGSDVFFSKFNVSGSLLWGTYLGGSEGNDQGFSLAVTEDGNCFVIGYTNSDDFPTQNAFDNTLGSTSDAFVTKFFDPPIPPTNPLTVTGFLIFIAVMLSAVIPVIALIVYKKRK
jgi:hypothetical protein